MVRAPCCEKMGLKRGPWTPEEDRILIAFIQSYGHGNWRALPKQAGLLRCGKSCRLRWTNYLRPDIKRGNFTSEEEETIIKLHEKLGNRWAAIAGRLPGRTDNEIKNVWHTHLKKRLKKNTTPETSNNSVEASGCEDVTKLLPQPTAENSGDASVSPRPSSSDSSSIVTVDNHDTDIKDDYNESAHTTDHDGCNNPPDNFFDIDENFWTDALLGDFSPSESIDHTHPSTLTNSYKIDDSMDFWFDLYIQSSDEQPVLL